MTTLDKVIRPGDRVFCRIKWDGKRLSISGVEGPKPNGDCAGSCGQISMPDFKSYAPGWDTDLAARFWHLWDRWHLNDMRAGCEHQRKIDASERVEVVEYGLTSEAYRMRVNAMERAAIAAASHKPSDLNATEEALILMPKWCGPHYAPPDADSPLSGCFEVKKREQKTIGWVRQDEHPRGMLSRPCEVCGYKYGSAWLVEEVPADVIDFLKSLPDADMTPAWV